MASDNKKGVQMSSSVDVKAETGATVNAPVFAGNTITAPVTFNYSSSTAGNEPQKTLAKEKTEKQLKGATIISSL
ncbi:hypothetical protein F2P79_024612 [Pimephales promelas]|nr:hypothetical protein F2P79_024612 [Pimephales promelas]